MNRPTPDEYPQYYKGYIELVPDDVIRELENQLTRISELVAMVTPDKENYAYAEGKWTLREVFGHIIDTERIMAYRLLCISRGEPATLPGFDENIYIANSNYKSQKLSKLEAEFQALRISNIYQIKSLDDMQKKNRGVANGTEISVLSLIFILAGHFNHHAKIITERYS